MSLVLATEYRVANFDRWRTKVSKDLSALGRFSAHHLVIYRSIEQEDRVFVTIGIHDRRRLEALLSSPEVFSWFDAAEVDEIPPIFAGEVIEKLSLVEATAFHGTSPVVVAGVVPIEDFDRFWAFVHAEVDGIAAAGVRQWWTYRALDDPVEVMILQEIASEAQAERWLSHPENVSRWMSRAGVGVYPPLFVGRVVDVVDLSKVS
jgi:hypothetical protein